MKKHAQFVGVALFLTASLLAHIQPLHAGIIGVEQFDYPDSAINGKSGGTFWDYKNFPTTGHTGTASNWDNVSGAPVVTNGRLVTNNNSAKREYNGTLESDGAVNDPASAPSSVAKSVYYRVNVTSGPTLPDFFGISSQDFGNEKLFFGKRSGQPKFGIDETGVSGTDATTTPDISPNTTYTLVVRIDYNANLVRLFVDPDLNAPEPAAPAASPAYTGTNWSTAVRLASGTGGSVTWDNLVVATTWDDLGTVVTTTADNDDGSLNPALGGVSLREAVNHSPTGTLITFDTGLSGQTITLTHADGDMEVPGALTIDASNLPGGLTVDGNNASRHFHVGLEKILTLRGLTLSGGNSGGDGGGSIFSSNALTLTQCTLTGNTAPFGGAILNAATLTMTHCTLSGNTSGYGGAISNNEVTSLTNCTLSGNTASQDGGAILNLFGTVTLNNSIVAGNATGSGSGADIWNGDTVTRVGANLVQFLHNELGGNVTGSGTISTAAPKLSPLGHFGGPVQTMHPLIGSPAIDAGGTTNPGGTDQRGFARFVDGEASSSGAQLDIGAVEAGPLRTVTTIVDGISGALRNQINLSSTPGARIGFSNPFGDAGLPYFLTDGELTIPSTANGLFIDASNLTAPVTISGNNASRVFNIPATTTVAMHSLRIVSGRAPDGQNVTGTAAQPGGNGGGVLNEGTLSLFSCTVSGNRAGNGGSNSFNGSVGGGGGGIFSSGSLALTASTVSGNAAGNGGLKAFGGTGGAGGGIFSNGPLTLTACTISGNGAGNGASGTSGGDGGNGGAVWRNDVSPYRIAACTLVSNRSGSGGSGISVTLNGDVGQGGGVSGGNVQLSNCLIAQNTRGDGTPNDANVSFLTYLGPNLFGTAAVGTVTGTAPIINPNPLLAPLSDYGGPTQTMPPLPGSPAINAATGSTAITDQRGLPRVGTPDLGAAEYQGTTDLRLFWSLDTDGDGSPFGIEHALGTNPLLSDSNSVRNLTGPTLNLQGQATINFGRNPSAAPGTISILKRSTDLLTFTEIFRINGNTITNASGISATVNANDITVLDPNPPSPKAFYLFQAVAP